MNQQTFTTLVSVILGFAGGILAAIIAQFTNVRLDKIKADREEIREYKKKLQEAIEYAMKFPDRMQLSTNNLMGACEGFLRKEKDSNELIEETAINLARMYPQEWQDHLITLVETSQFSDRLDEWTRLYHLCVSVSLDKIQEKYWNDVRAEVMGYISQMDTIIRDMRQALREEYIKTYPLQPKNQRAIKP
ncbi:MAG TPA: hypothetical protein VFA07_00885 [Chthonomonadaceae bacterium]|nr:hypothetical protein [Chthonomonadaceae bacterium]